jgi:acyl-CoA thioesterase FadM
MMLKYDDNLRPRIADINYGGHLGHMELIGLLHEIRMRFLKLYGLNEVDIFGHALIMRELSLTYKNQVYWNDKLNFKVKLSFNGAKIIFDYVVSNLTQNNQTAIVTKKMVLINKKITSL